MILTWLVWWATAGLMTREVDAAISADVQALDERWQDGGLELLTHAIEDRVNRDVDDNAIYLLTDATMQRIAGNLDRWPTLLPENELLATVGLDHLGSHVARVAHYQLRGGYHLLVGRDTRKRDEMVHILTGAMLWVIGCTVVLVLLGAAMMRGLFQLTLADLSRTSAAIGAGDLGRRLPVTGRGDEFDVLAETINQMLDRIGLLMEGVRNVSNAIAHDLRTPITRARARLEYAARPGASEAELRAAIERAQADLDAIVRVFQALLRIAEIESGTRRAAFAPFDLASLLDDLGETYAVVAEEASQTLSHDVPARLPVFGDREMIQQAVANLLDNALKYSPPGSAIRLSATLDGDVPRIVVADRGPGMAAADRASAGRRFFRSESARSTPGSGLGLALVSAVATLHGGSLRLEDNAPGLRAVLTLAPVGGGSRLATEVAAASSDAHEGASLIQAR